MKKGVLILVSIVLTIVAGLTGVYLAKVHNDSDSQDKQSVVNNIQQNSVSTNQQKTQEKQNDTYLIDGISTYPLTATEFKDAVGKGIAHKSHEKDIGEEKTLTCNNGMLIVCSIDTPYLFVAEEAEKYARQYKNVTYAEIANKTPNRKLCVCTSVIVGESVDFYKNIHMVLKVYYGNNQVKVIQPNEDVAIERNSLNNHEKVTGLGGKRSYSAVVQESFESKEIVPLNPEKIEAVLIDGSTEIVQSFNYKELNQL
ncbi:hypothetical protein HBE96_00375 [Clostridium sp. P21]|uniref:Uncharacterized protein n=1 Tax=Clostridium muellerianum TaxID=2716538 RepID=A0A7Y0EDM0_9CLOT|nr:hypothetical protein [Clostridium muellerianum]NMM61182.1 hypothetical protein [Clostridium muellerianum]